MREVAAECGALSNKTMRALDSTVLFDAVATQDTVTMISAQIRRVRRLAPAAAGLVLGHDYDSRAKPVCDWDDPDERAWLIDDLVTDAQRVLDALDGSELTEEQAQAAALLAVVAGQDVEADPKVPGRWRIARRMAPGRVISTVDPEARHARKSRSRRRDGYKAHICTEPDAGLITAVELTTADTSNAQVGLWVPKTQSWLVRPHVPTQQRVGGDQPPGSARSRERGRYRSEQGPVGVGELGSVDLSAQHSELVAQHDDLEVLRAA